VLVLASMEQMIEFVLPRCNIGLQVMALRQHCKFQLIHHSSRHQQLVQGSNQSRQLELARRLRIVESLHLRCSMILRSMEMVQKLECILEMVCHKQILVVRVLRSIKSIQLR
jgi:hypothetical protein